MSHHRDNRQPGAASLAGRRAPARAREGSAVLVAGVLPAEARLALRREEAAAALGVSDETFDRWARPHLPVVRLGTVRIYPVAHLQAFLDANASAPVEDVAA